MVGLNGTNTTIVAETSREEFGPFQYMIFGVNIPFLIIYSILFSATLISLIFSVKKQDKTKRKTFYILILVLSLLFAVILNLLTRIGSELCYFETDPDRLERIYGLVKAIDRTMIGFTMSMELLLIDYMSFLL